MMRALWRRVTGQTESPRGGEHAVDTARTAQAVTSLKTVLVTGPVSSFVQDFVQDYLKDRATSGGRPVTRFQELGAFTYLAEFSSETDARNAVSTKTHTMVMEHGRYPLLVFLHDEQSGSVYSGHNTVYWEQGGETRQADIPRGEPEATNILLVTGVPYGWLGITAESIKDQFEGLDTVRGRLTEVVCVEATRTAFVQFEDGQDARALITRGAAELKDSTGQSFTVQMYLYRGALSRQADVTTAPAGSSQVSPQTQLGGIEANVQAAIARLEAQFRREVGRIQQEMDGRLNSESRQPQDQIGFHLNQLQEHMQAGFSEIQQQLAAALNTLRSQLRLEEVQAEPTVPQIQSQLKTDINQLLVEVTELRRLMQGLDQSHTNMLAEAQPQSRADIRRLTREIRSLSFRAQAMGIQRAPRSPGRLGSTDTQTQRQQEPRFAIENPSDCDTESVSSTSTEFDSSQQGQGLVVNNQSDESLSFDDPWV